MAPKKAKPKAKSVQQLKDELEAAEHAARKWEAKYKKAAADAARYQHSAAIGRAVVAYIPDPGLRRRIGRTLHACLYCLKSLTSCDCQAQALSVDAHRKHTPLVKPSRSRSRSPSVGGPDPLHRQRSRSRSRSYSRDRCMHATASAPTSARQDSR